jgi:PAS domain S-box-containing protein
MENEILKGLLQDSVIQLSSILDSTSDMIWTVDAENFGLINWNNSFQEYFEMDRSMKLAVGQTPADLFPKDSPFVALWNEMFSTTLKEGFLIQEYTTFAWTRILQLNFGLLKRDNSIFGISVFARNITAQKQAESKLEKTNRLYNVISQVNKAIVHIKDKKLLFEQVCKTAIDFGKFRMAWIGLVDEKSQMIKPVSWAGYEEGYLSVIKPISIKDVPEGRGPTGNAIWEGKHFVCSDYETEPSVSIWREEALRRGYHSSIALPLTVFGKVKGTFSLYSSTANFFDDMEVDLLTGVAHDIGFALQTIALHQNHEKVISALVKSEERFRSIFNNLQDAFLQIDLDGIFTMVSPSAVRLYGYASAEELLGMHVDKLYANLRERKELHSILKEKGKVLDFIAEGRRKDGTTFWVSMNVQFFYKNGKVAGTEGVVRDITEHRTDEDKIRTFFRVVEQSPVSIVITDSSGNIEYVNPKFSQITGYTSEEVVGKNPRILKSDSKTPDDYQELWKRISSGCEWHGEFYNVKKNGEHFYESASISPVVNEEGSITHYIAIKEDITGRKKNEEHIKTLSAVVEQSSSMIVITDKRGKIEYVNSEFSNFTQYSPEEIVGKISWIFNQKHHTEASYQQMWESLNSQQVWHKEQQNRKKDGSLFWENVTVFPLVESEGETRNYIIINDDITEKQNLVADLILAKEKAEMGEQILKEQKDEIELNNERLESLLRISSYPTDSTQDLLDFALNEAIILTRSKIGYIYFYNESSRQFILNTWSKSVMKECTVLNVQTVYDLDKTGCWGEAVRQRKPIMINDYESENEMKRGVPEGHVKLHRFLTIPVIMDHKIVAVAGVANKMTDYNNSDIRQMTLLMDNVWKMSERFTLMENLRSAKEKAEESDRLKSAFLANMSHEIRTPMNGILGFTELLKEPDLDGENQQFYIKIIEESGARMLNLMNDIMDISRIEAGEVIVKLATCDVRRQLQYIHDFFTKEANSKGIELMVRSLLTFEEARITSDEQKLEAILVNLVKNAIKFTQKGQIEIGCQKAGSFLQFYVKDSGVGIDPQHREIIFHRFRQGSESLSRPYEGAGLGLAISKAYVEILGGRIWVESNKDESSGATGSTFFFTLPGKLEVTEDSPDGEPSGYERAPRLHNDLKVLLVEDDEFSMNLLEIITGEFSKEIYTATNGEEAIEVFNQHPDIDLILMDMKMPVMDGFEATRKIRQFNKEVIILAQTAYSMIGDRERVMAVGCNDYLTKPVNKEELRSLVKIHIK